MQSEMMQKARRQKRLFDVAGSTAHRLTKQVTIYDLLRQTMIDYQNDWRPASLNGDTPSILSNENDVKKSAVATDSKCSIGDTSGIP